VWDWNVRFDRCEIDGLLELVVEICLDL